MIKKFSSPANKLRIFSISFIIIFLVSLISPTGQFEVRAATPAFPPPVLLSPENGAVTTNDNFPPNAVPEFTWQPLAGATSYRFQICKINDCSTTVVNITTPYPRYTPVVLMSASVLTDNVYFWRVKVENPAPPAPSANAWSDPFEWNKDWQGKSLATPNKPILTLPVDNATLSFFENTAFYWQPIIGANKYRFQFYTDSTFTTGKVYESDVPGTSFQPLNRPMNGTYYWRVIPIDAGGNLGYPSDYRTIMIAFGSGAGSSEIPVQLEPLDELDPNYKSPIFTPTFRWKAVKGAQMYELQYTNANACAFSNEIFTTDSTTYTPRDTMVNDDTYCWHVRAVFDPSNGSKTVSDWSTTWHFQKKWNLQAIPLNPTNLYQYASAVLFNWTDVPGAASYIVEGDTDNTFPPNGDSGCKFSKQTSEPSIFQIWGTVCLPYSKPPTDTTTYYWHVIPVDASNHGGLGSELPPGQLFSFRGDAWDYRTPQLLYPEMYHVPNPTGVVVSPAQDHIAAYPVFMWHRLMQGSFLLQNQQANAYRVEVATNPQFLPGQIVWMAETENLSVSPTSANPFTPVPGTDYYWRVAALTGLNGSLSTGQYSEVWLARFDTIKALAPTASITLLRPEPAAEYSEITPRLEWWPLQGADSYRVQISSDPNFAAANINNEAYVSYPTYTPSQRLHYYPHDAGNPHSDLQYGTYYWRVIGRYNGADIGNWSTPWRFEIASTNHWRTARTMGAGDTLKLHDWAIGYDDSVDAPVGDPVYDLTDLYASETGVTAYWYFGLTVPSPTSTNVGYAMFLDLDKKDGSGASAPPPEPVTNNVYNLSFIPAHKPEYAILILPTGTSPMDASMVWIYSYNSTLNAWNLDYKRLDQIGGSVYYDPLTKYLELQIPPSSINMVDTTGSMTISMVSVDRNTRNVKDSLPASTSSTLDRWTTVSGHLTLTMPFNNAAGDPSSYPILPRFSFEQPIDTPYGGWEIQVGLDPKFTTTPLISHRVNPTNGPNNMYGDYYTTQDITGGTGGANDVFYWRVRPVYYDSGPKPTGSWSAPNSFKRVGFQVNGLKVNGLTDNNPTISFTPTFNWNIMEGANLYNLQVNSNDTFNGTSYVDIKTAMTSFTPTSNLGNGVYYWKVCVERYGGIQNDCSRAEIRQFTITMDTPTGLTPNDPAGSNPFETVPTLCWTPFVKTVDNIPLIAAWKYRVNVYKASAPTTVFETVDTDSACWTPYSKGYEDGQYSWNVAIIMNGGKVGGFSPAAQFTKRGAVPNLVLPEPGANLADIPSYIWTPVYGAKTYELEVAQDDQFARMQETTVRTNNVSYTSSKTNYVRYVSYWWRVRAVDAFGIKGPWATAIIQAYRTIFLPTLIRAPIP